jgi:hypothetical protein
MSRFLNKKFLDEQNQIKIVMKAMSHEEFHVTESLKLCRLNYK